MRKEGALFGVSRQRWDTKQGNWLKHQQVCYKSTSKTFFTHYNSKIKSNTNYKSRACEVHK